MKIIVESELTLKCMSEIFDNKNITNKIVEQEGYLDISSINNGPKVIIRKDANDEEFKH
jgi:hypothetical protein